MEADEVDAAVDGADERDEHVGVGYVVVDVAPHYVFELETALVGEVVARKEFHDGRDGIGFLRRHHRLALCRIGGVDTDGYVHLCAVQEFLELGEFADSADCDALGTPRESPWRGEYLEHYEELLQIVEGFAHAHEDDVGKVAFVAGIARRYGEDLVDDLGGGELRLESGLACGTEIAVHAASGL